MVHELAIAGVYEVRFDRKYDSRGYFSEIFRRDLFASKIGDVFFCQENESFNVAAGTIRGLHFQVPPFPQGKLVRCTSGAIFDVAVDLRIGSPDFGRWVSVELRPDKGNWLWIPPGFAHGFCTLKPDSVLNYKVTEYYSAECDMGVAWDDPDICIEWPPMADIDTLSMKDRLQPKLSDLPPIFYAEDTL